MSDAQTPAPRGSILSEIDLPLFASMSLHTVLVYVAVVLARVTASYAMLDLGLSFFWVGVISSAYALIPIFIAVPLGRLNDRGYDSLTIRAGSVGLTLAALIFWLVTPGPLSLFIATAILGVGQITCMGGHQMVCLRAGKTTRGRDAVFGYQMVAIASGLGFGPLLVAWIAGDALRPPISLLFGVLVIVTLLTLASSFLVKSGPTRDRKTDAAAPVGLIELLKMRGLLAYVIASIMTITALDLIVIYLPLLGAERHLDVATVGLIMAVRAASSMTARLVYVPLVDLMGRGPLTYLAMLSPAVAFIVVASPAPLWALYPAMVGAGMGLGVSATLTLSGVVDLAPPTARATAMSLRLTGNRIGLIIIPMGASMIAAFTGAAGVFVILAACLTGSAASIWRGRRQD